MQLRRTLLVLMARGLPLQAKCASHAESPIQQAIELRPNLVFLSVGYVAIGTFVFWLHSGSWRFRLMMIEIVVAPAARVGIALGILDGYISAIKGTREIA